MPHCTVLENLSDEDEDVRQSAVTGLASQVASDPDIRAALLEKLSDEY